MNFELPPELAEPKGRRSAKRRKPAGTTTRLRRTTRVGFERVSLPEASTGSGALPDDLPAPIADAADDVAALALPAELPDRIAGAVDRPAINFRKAMAGLYLLAGEGSLAHCLRRAGYSEATASNSGKCGLTAEACVEEAGRMTGESAPAKLVSLARARMAQGLHAADPLRTPLKDLTRAFEAIERLHGSKETGAGARPLPLADRLVIVGNLLVVAQERGLPIPALDRLLAKLGNGASCDSPPKNIEIPPTADNDQYVNSHESPELRPF